MSKRPNDYRRPLMSTIFAVGGAALAAGLVIALVQSTAPYGLAGGLMAMGMFILGIGIGGVLFTPREGVPTGA